MTRTYLFAACFILLNVVVGPAITLGLIENRAIYFLGFLPVIFAMSGLKWERKFNPVLYSMMAYGLYIIILGLYTGKTSDVIISYLKNMGFPFAAFYIVNFTVTKENYKRIIKLCFVIGAIQIPVVVVQYVFYEFLIKYSVISIAPYDFKSGTFYPLCDTSLGFFLLVLILYLLLSRQEIIRLKYRYLLIIAFSATIFLSEAVVIKLSLLGIVSTLVTISWFKIVKKRVSHLLVGLNCFTIALCTLIFLFDKSSYISAYVSAAINNLYVYFAVSSNNLSKFYEGGYARTAGFINIFYNPLKFIGDGMGTYFDPFSLIYSAGVNGHFLLSYYEIGIFGLGLGYYMIWSIGKTYLNRPKLFAWLLFANTLIVSLTIRPLEDLSLLITLILFLKIGYMENDNAIREQKG